MGLWPLTGGSLGKYFTFTQKMYLFKCIGRCYKVLADAGQEPLP